jgi:hypothetical protein
MSLDTRLSRLAPGLTAQERAILVLEAWKDDRPEDPSWRNSMPTEQTRAFNHYIELMNKANLALGRVIGVIHMQAEALEQREAWLMSMVLWMDHIEEIARAVRLAVREPVTESEYNAQVEANREEWVPVEELAAFLAGQREYADDDFEESEADWPEVKDDVWERAVAEEEERLRKLVAAGKLPSRGKGKALKLQQRAIMHFGHENYLSYRVVPDDHAESVEVERESLRRLQQAIDWQSGDGPETDELTDLPQRMCEGLKATTAHRIISTWVLLHSVEAVVNEIGESFNGIDPLRPVFREKREATRAKLLAIQEHLRVLNIEVELRDPLAEEIQEIRGWLEDSPANSS